MRVLLGCELLLVLEAHEHLRLEVGALGLAACDLLGERAVFLVRLHDRLAALELTLLRVDGFDLLLDLAPRDLQIAGRLLERGDAALLGVHAALERLLLGGRLREPGAQHRRLLVQLA
jgi:hypothetical protein